MKNVRKLRDLMRGWEGSAPAQSWAALLDEAIAADEAESDALKMENVNLMAACALTLKYLEKAPWSEKAEELLDAINKAVTP